MPLLAGRRARSGSAQVRPGRAPHRSRPAGERRRVGAAVTTIDWPPNRPPRSGRVALLAILAVLFIGGLTTLSYYVESIWFLSLGFSDVFWTTLNLRAWTFIGFTLVTFAVLYLAFTLLKPARLGELGGGIILVNGQPVRVPVEPVIRLIGIGVAIAIALVTGLAMSAEWSTFALYWHGSLGELGTAATTAAATDPIFGRPLSFYLFSLPVWQLLSGWATTLGVVSFAAAVAFAVIAGGTRVLEGRRRLHASDATAARGVRHVRLRAARRRTADVSGPVLAHLCRPHDLRGRLVHRRPRDDQRPADCRHPDGRRRADRRGGRCREAEDHDDCRSDCSSAPVLRHRQPRRVVRVQLHRAAESAGAREPVHQPQHRAHPPRLRARSHRTEGLPGRSRHRGGGREQQSRDDREHPALGLARAAGHAAADPGNPDLLRLSRHRHRPVHDRRARCDR